jgi:hypothetical protein
VAISLRISTASACRSIRRADRSTSPAVRLALVPLARPPVQGGHEVGLRSVQAAAQQVNKEMVVAVPLPAVVEGHDKEIGAFETPQDRARIHGRGSFYLPIYP